MSIRWNFFRGVPPVIFTIEYLHFTFSYMGASLNIILYEQNNVGVLPNLYKLVADLNPPKIISLRAQN